MSIPAHHAKQYLRASLTSLAFALINPLFSAQAQESALQRLNQATPVQTQANASQQGVIENQLNQAELDQLLAPIALYPDTLLSHILVASTYPLEIIQAARWRAANKDLDEQQALDAVEDKDWDPSVKALIPFYDLLQKFSDDLDWLQALGDAFLSNEEQVLASIQILRQKAYALGNLQNNEYVEVSKDEDKEIVIRTVDRQVVYVPYYDTRVVYGNWWWDAYPPYYWNRPSHYVFSGGFFWSPRYSIRPAFYFGGFHWHQRYVVADYGYRSHAHRYWSRDYNRQVVRVREYPRWTHDEHHRRGVHYTINGGRSVTREYQKVRTNPNRYVTSTVQVNTKQRNQIDKRRVLNVHDYPSVKKERVVAQVSTQPVPASQRPSQADKVQAQLHNNKNRYASEDKQDIEKQRNDKQRLISQAKGQQRATIAENVVAPRVTTNQNSGAKTNKVQPAPPAQTAQRHVNKERVVQERSQTQNNASSSSRQRDSNRASSGNQQAMRSVKSNKSAEHRSKD
ncbi:MAG: DUF3300 domain-containing protein [Paraglaciecola sp.]|nr:DUF3300 domain-containing protein [Paraglaciecola sp.]NCT49563.1 DUF3300 domain-containing protein [Paraglaciecola sp.]